MISHEADHVDEHVVVDRDAEQLGQPALDRLRRIEPELGAHRTRRCRARWPGRRSRSGKRSRSGPAASGRCWRLRGTDTLARSPVWRSMLTTIMVSVRSPQRFGPASPPRSAMFQRPGAAAGVVVAAVVGTVVGSVVGAQGRCRTGAGRPPFGRGRDAEVGQRARQGDVHVLGAGEHGVEHPVLANATQAPASPGSVAATVTTTRASEPATREAAWSGEHRANPTARRRPPRPHTRSPTAPRRARPSAARRHPPTSSTSVVRSWRRAQAAPRTTAMVGRPKSAAARQRRWSTWPRTRDERRRHCATDSPGHRPGATPLRDRTMTRA